MNDHYDAIVIGSGFGGAVTGCRLAEKGYRVLILERGRRWKVDEYPRDLDDAWVWDQDHPEKRNGWVDLRVFPHMAVAQGAGVGGGSLLYASALLEPTEDLFDEGWPPEITYAELKPYYQAVSQMLNLQVLPENQWTERARLMREAAEKAGHSHRFRQVDLAVSFDESWNYELDDPHSARHSKKFVNAQGQEQGTCVHMGNCDLGCDVKAKNTLDLNYIPRAEKHGAEVRPLHLVRRIEPENGGYRVRYDRIEGGQRHPGSVAARIVVLAAGSMGTTELLLRCRQQHRTLPGLSEFLGRKWSGNGDFVTPSFHLDRDVAPTRGPTISSFIDFRDRSVDGEYFLIEEGGFPDVLHNWLEQTPKGWSWHVYRRALVKSLRQILRHPLKHAMPWFAQGRDAADGQLALRKKWWLFGPRRLFLRWDIDKSRKVFDTIVEMHKKLAQAANGEPIVPLTWTLAKYLITPHPLGGCRMSTSSENGVVDHRGEVFGHRNLYVADGAIIPGAIGANPSKTIAALAERIASLIAEEGR